MVYLTVFLTCLMACPLFAETIANVEYHLPEQAKSWKIGNELQSNSDIKSTTIIYVPESISNDDPKQFFGAHSNNLPLGEINRQSLRKLLQLQYPDQHVDVSILETATHSVLFEFSVKEKGNEKIHGWTRAFSTEEGSVMLSYQTEQVHNTDKLGSMWLEALKDAKFMK
jgi:hypothetical protein